MFEEEERKLEQRRKSIEQIEVPKDKLHYAVQNGFEKAKKEQLLKRTKLRKRSSWSIVIAAILLVSFITSISVSPAFANKIASIPGMERIVGLIYHDRGLTAAVENDFYQPLNLSQEKNGITVTLDGVIADKKGMVIFYSVRTEDMDVGSLELTYQRLRSKMNFLYSYEFITSTLPLTPNTDEKVFSGSEYIEKVVHDKDLSWAIGLKNGEKIEHFNIPFAYEKTEVDSKNFIVDKEFEIEGQRFKVKELIVDPIRTVVQIEENPNNTKKLLARPFDELELVDEKGRKWSALPGNAYKPIPTSNIWLVPLKESFYFYEPQKLSLSVGKVSAMDKEEAHILIDTESEKFIDQPSQSIFSNLQVKDNTVSLSVKIDKEYDTNMVRFIKFIDANEKEFYIHYGGRTPPPSNYVKGSRMTSPGEVNIEFELPNKALSNFASPIRLELDFYPSWIEEDVKVDIKQ